MNRFTKLLAWIMVLIMTAALFTIPVFAEEGSGDDSNFPINKERPDPNTMQTEYDITLVPSPIAQDDEEGNLVIRLYISYRDERDFGMAPLSYFRIEPVVSTDPAVFPFRLDQSSYELG